MNEKCQQLHFADSLKTKPDRAFTNMSAFINTTKSTIRWNFVQFWVLNLKRTQKIGLHSLAGNLTSSSEPGWLSQRDLREQRACMQKNRETLRARTYAGAPGCEIQAWLGLNEAYIFFFPIFFCKYKRWTERLLEFLIAITKRQAQGFLTARHAGSNDLQVPSDPFNLLFCVVTAQFLEFL